MFGLSISPLFKDLDQLQSLQKDIEANKEISTYSSGSTGLPKEIKIPVSNMMASAEMTNAFFELTESTHAVLALSLDTIAGKMMLLRAMAGNYSLNIQPASLRPLEKVVTKVDFIAMVPAQLQESLEKDGDKLKEIRVILVGGGAISPVLEEKLKQEKLTVYHSFGMTETISHIAMRKVGYASTSYFEALPAVRFSTKEGKLVIDAPRIGVHQLGTNDVVELLSETQFEWLGRADFVVNSGGYKIQLEALEARLSVDFSVPFFLWKEPHETWGEQLILCVESEMERPVVFSIELKNWEKPKKTYFLKQFLRSESGKILRKATFEQIPMNPA